MTKKDIVKKIAAEMGLSQDVVHAVVQRTLDEIVETLVRDKRIELRNFGVFEVKVRSARKARNPRTNEWLRVPRRAALSFKPGKQMAERVAALPLEELERSFRRLMEPPKRGSGGAGAEDEPAGDLPADQPQH